MNDGGTRVDDTSSKIKIYLPQDLNLLKNAKVMGLYIDWLKVQSQIFNNPESLSLDDSILGEKKPKAKKTKKVVI